MPPSLRCITIDDEGAAARKRAQHVRPQRRHLRISPCFCQAQRRHLIISPCFCHASDDGDVPLEDDCRAFRARKIRQEKQRELNGDWHAPCGGSRQKARLRVHGRQCICELRRRQLLLVLELHEPVAAVASHVQLRSASQGHSTDWLHVNQSMVDDSRSTPVNTSAYTLHKRAAQMACNCCSANKLRTQVRSAAPLLCLPCAGPAHQHIGCAVRAQAF